MAEVIGSKQRDEIQINLMVERAVSTERERCAKIAESWIATFGTYAPEHVSAQTWATDAVRDIAEEIRKPAK